MCNLCSLSLLLIFLALLAGHSSAQGKVLLACEAVLHQPHLSPSRGAVASALFAGIIHCPSTDCPGCKEGLSCTGYPLDITEAPDAVGRCSFDGQSGCLVSAQR